MNKIIPIVLLLTILGSIVINGQWTLGNNSPIRITALYANNEIIISASGNKVYTSMNNGKDWEFRGEIPIYDYTIRGFTMYDNEVYAVTGVGVWKSLDKGVNWKDVNNGINNVNTRTIIVLGEKILVGTYGHGVFGSTNKGANWYPVNMGLTNLVIRDFNIKDDLLFVATDEGVFVTADSVINWRAASYGLPNGKIGNLTSSEESIFAAPYSSLYSSPDNGANWNKINFTSSSQFVRALTSYQDNIFVGVISGGEYGQIPGGVHLSTDNGLNWDEINDGLFELSVSDLSINEKYVFAGSSDGIYFQKLSSLIHEIDDIIIENFSIENFSLQQNYPNPFNPSTTINYTIPNRSLVKLNVYNSLGQKVAELVNEEKPSGNNEVEFNADGLTSGVYFYVLKAGGFVEIKKMVLLR